MQKPSFTAVEIAAWNDAFDRDRPTTPTEAEWPEFPQVDTFRAGILTVGVALRLKAKSGETFNLLLNPVSARELATAILSGGQQAGWLDGKGLVVSPPAAPFDA